MLKYIKLFIILALMNRCGNSTKNNLQLNEGNKAISFSEINIGKQIWMAANLNAGKFRNGDLIPEAKTFEQWKQAGENKQPAWCYYNNDSTKRTKYGKLYNWYAVNDPRVLAPKKWHVPSETEWTALIDYSNIVSEAAINLKANSGWGYFEEKSGNGNNSSGFNALPGGYFSFCSNSFEQIGYCGAWWTSTSTDVSSAVFCLISFRINSVDKAEWDKIGGFSVRCVKD
jgi:uncharacterized protein (TIGR02145 family)